jgi:hypothetical protein
MEPPGIPGRFTLPGWMEAKELLVLLSYQLGDLLDAGELR